MDSAQWPQDIGLMKPMDHNQHHHQDQVTTPNTCNRAIGGERRATRPQEQLNCPRCNSTNTKFCYYNNYSLTQPRYFCKGCRRYWTEGGSLRNVPVGGGSRKNKRSPAATTSSYKLPDLNPPISTSLHQNPNNETHQAGQDLNLSFQVIHGQQDHHHQGTGSFIQLPKMENHEHQNESNNPSSSSSALDLLRTGIASRGLNSFIPRPMPDSNTLYSASAGFTLQEFKPTHQLSFPVDALGNSSRYENNGGAGSLFFPFGDFSKQLAARVAESDQDKGQSGNNPNRHWNGMLQGGGGSW